MFDLGFGYDTGEALARSRSKSKIEEYLKQHPELTSSERETLKKAAEEVSAKEYRKAYDSASLL